MIKKKKNLTGVYDDDAYAGQLHNIHHINQLIVILKSMIYIQPPSLVEITIQLCVLVNGSQAFNYSSTATSITVVIFDCQDVSGKYCTQM